MDFVKEDTSRSEVLKAQAHIWNHTFQIIVSMSLRCAVVLGIPDAIRNHGQPITLHELANVLHINPKKISHLYRLMRFLAHSGYVETKRVDPSDHNDQESETYQLTPIGELLLKDNPYTMRSYILLILDPIMTKPWDCMSTWLRNEDPDPFFSVHQMTLWESTGSDQRMSNSVNEAMVSDSVAVAGVLTRKCRWAFEGVKRLVDVGGNTGTMGRAISQAFPEMEYVVFDQPHVLSNLKSSGNLKYVGGDMFEAVPPADAVLIKWVLHDWSDDHCVKILARCKEAITSNDEKGGKVMIIEMVLEDDQPRNREETQTQLFFDLAAMAALTGRQRNEKEWAKLIYDAGFSSYKIHPVLHLRSLIEVYP